MFTHPRLSLVSFIIFTLCCSLTESRHVHQHHAAHHLQRKHLHHRHGNHARQVDIASASPIFATIPSPSATPVGEAALPSLTAADADAVADDLDQIQTELDDFTSDLSAFFRRIKEWLQAFRALLENDGASSELPPELGPELPTSIPEVNATGSLTFHEPVPVLTVAPSAPSEATTSTGFMTVTSTRTRNNTINTYVTVPYANVSVPANGTAPLILSTVTPYPALNMSSAKVTPAVTPSVTLVASVTSVTISGSIFTSAASTYSLSPSPTPYTFDASSNDNVAVYYGTTPSTTIGGLLSLCANPNVDIVILSFIYDFFPSDGSGYPTLDFGPGCAEPNTAQRAAGATGLKDCSALAPEIAGCQAIGKKVLVSLGGYNANSSFDSADQAARFADTLWGLFGAGYGVEGQVDRELRPFGSSLAIAVDGFDIDNEDGHSDYYDAFALRLRERFSTDPGREYYLSAAPQCPIPDASISDGVLAAVDFVWVQFYNNPSCNLDTEGFQSSFARWSSQLSALSTPVQPSPGPYTSGSAGVTGGPRFYIGVPSFPGGGPGYVDGAALYSRITQARKLDVPNLGGIMLWDGTEAVDNVDGYGIDYLGYAKDALHL